MHYTILNQNTLAVLISYTTLYPAMLRYTQPYTQQ